MLIVGASALTPCPNFAAQLFSMQTPSPSKPPVCRAAATARHLFAACALFACFASADAQQPAQTPERDSATREAAVAGGAVKIIPKPKSLTETGESFRLSRDVRIVLADPKSEDDRLAAQDFIDDARETAGVNLR